MGIDENRLQPSLIAAYENRARDPQALLAQVRAHLKPLAFADEVAAGGIRSYVLDLLEGAGPAEHDRELRTEARHLYNTMKAMQCMRLIQENFMAYAKEPLDKIKFEMETEDGLPIRPGHRRLEHLQELQEIMGQWEKQIAPEWKPEYGETPPELTARLEAEREKITQSRKKLVEHYSGTHRTPDGFRR